MQWAACFGLLENTRARPGQPDGPRLYRANGEDDPFDLVQRRVVQPYMGSSNLHAKVGWTP